MPIRFFPPRNFIFGVEAQQSYDVGNGYQYGTIAAAIAAAAANAAVNPLIVLHDATFNEDVSLPKGYHMIGVLQQGFPAVTINGNYGNAAGSGVSNVVGVIIAGSGIGATISANAGMATWFSECFLKNNGDNPVLSGSAGANCALFNTIFYSNAATAPVMSIMAGNISTVECSTLGQPTSGLFASISGGTLTDRYSQLSGQILTSGSGSFNGTGTEPSTVGTSCIEHSGSTPSYLIGCKMSRTNPGEVLSGTGTIYYDELDPYNNGFEYAATLNLVPLNRTLGKKGSDVASGNDIILGVGNYFDVTGNTQINTISGLGWTPGSEVILQFDSNPLVAHNTAGTGAVILLQGSEDFQAGADSTLTIKYDGVVWRETSRTAA